MSGGRGTSPESGIRSVYVHAPFCARRCVYCDFAVTVDRSPRLDPWLRALRGELAALAAENRFRLAASLDTLFVGGGTPSLLGPAAMAGLASVLGPHRLEDPSLEWTAEANPESFTLDLARSWRRAGVNRVSLGVQSFSRRALAWMGRLHGPAGARTAVGAARRAGIENVSVDLIFGLPAHLKRDWRGDLNEVVDLDPPHVSLYGLTVEPDTRLGRAVAEGRETVADESRYADEYLEAVDVLAAAGFVHYEVSNFARPGHESRHNLAYWTGRPYLGLGNGAHSYFPPVRRWNRREWSDYRQAAELGVPAMASEELLSDDARRLERLWLGLRIREGIPLESLSPMGRDRCAQWAGRGLAVVLDGRVRLTATGWLILDRLAVDLDETESGPRPGPERPYGDSGSSESPRDAPGSNSFGSAGAGPHGH